MLEKTNEPAARKPTEDLGVRDMRDDTSVPPESEDPYILVRAPCQVPYRVEYRGM